MDEAWRGAGCRPARVPGRLLRILSLRPVRGGPISHVVFGARVRIVEGIDVPCGEHGRPLLDATRAGALDRALGVPRLSRGVQPERAPRGVWFRLRHGVRGGY